LLPIAGAALAALAAAHGWSILLSLPALAIVGAASAVIYRSGSLERVAFTYIPDVSAPEAEALETELSAAAPPARKGTRADRLVGDHVEQDLLTGLLAPEYFFARFATRLDQCSEAEQTAVLVICDIDQFGELNRTAGLVDANRILRSVADRLRLTVREGDLLARLGADEFALFFPGLSPDIAEARVRDLRAAVREAATLTLIENPQRVTASVGISCFPRDGERPEVLFEAADVALQDAKRIHAEQAGRPVPPAVVLPRTYPPVRSNRINEF